MRNMFAVLSMTMAVSLGAIICAYAAQDTPGAQTGQPSRELGVAPTGGQDDVGDLGPEQGFRRHHRMSIQSMLKKLGVTDQQKSEIKSLYTGYSDRTRKLRTDLTSLKDERKAMLISGKIDQQKLAQIDDQIVKLQSDLLKEKLKLRRERLAILTPEQIEKLGQWKAWKATHEKTKGMRGGMRHGRYSCG